MENKIENLLNDSVSTITSIIDKETSADSEYMEDKIVSALKDVAIGAFPSNQLYLSDKNLGYPFFQTISAAVSELNGQFGIIKILQQLVNENVTLSTGGDFIIEAPDKNKYYIISGENSEFTNGIYKNLTIKYTASGKYNGCIFENCNFEELNNTPTTLLFTGCTLNNCNLNCSGGNITLKTCTGFNNKYTASNVSVDGGGSLLLNIFNVSGNIDFTANHTNELNIIIEG